MVKKPDRDYASGESADFSDLQLDPKTGQLNQISADADRIYALWIDPKDD